tara:strand:- start:512 stop:1180 length:669 start_codon:yes stop_codon:yes gene_type:complete
LLISGIITAAGSGSRFGEEKQFKVLAGKPLYQYSVDVFLQSPLINEVILVVSGLNKELISQQLKSNFDYKDIKVIAGGKTRMDSVKNGVISSDNNSSLVCIHDAARPLISRKLIEDTVAACNDGDGAIVAIKAIDSIKYSKSKYIEKSINRDNIWLAQTPQTFNKVKLLEAYKNLNMNPINVTDESIIMEEMGFQIELVKSSQNNIKITTADDWKRVEDLIK